MRPMEPPGGQRARLGCHEAKNNTVEPPGGNCPEKTKWRHHPHVNPALGMGPEIATAAQKGQMPPPPCLPTEDPYKSHVGMWKQQSLVAVTAPPQAEEQVLTPALTGETHNVENSPDVGRKFKRYGKATDMTKATGRVEPCCWVEEVIFEPKAKQESRNEGSWTAHRLRAPHPQVLPGFKLLSWDHTSETALSAPWACCPAGPPFHWLPLPRGPGPRSWSYHLPTHLAVHTPLPLSLGPESPC